MRKRKHSRISSGTPKRPSANMACEKSLLSFHGPSTRSSVIPASSRTWSSAACQSQLAKPNSDRQNSRMRFWHGQGLGEVLQHLQLPPQLKCLTHPHEIVDVSIAIEIDVAPRKVVLLPSAACINQPA